MANASPLRGAGRIVTESRRRLSRDGRPISTFSTSDSARDWRRLTNTLMAGNVAVPPGLLPTPEPGGYVGLRARHLRPRGRRGAPPGGPVSPCPCLAATTFGPSYMAPLPRRRHGLLPEPSRRARHRRTRPHLAADGVLLRDSGEARDVDGTTWRRVVTPAGMEGWASEEFLDASARQPGRVPPHPLAPSPSSMPSPPQVPSCRSSPPRSSRHNLRS